MRQNIFLHFLNRDANKLVGIGKYVRKTDHKVLLSRALNASIILCGDFCIAPPGFLLETDLSLELFNNKRLYVTNGIIKLPRKEASMDDYVEKKRREYELVSDSFKGLFNDKYILQLTSAMPYFVLRKVSVGISATKNWEEASDTLPAWEKLRNQLSASALNNLVEAPRRLLEMNIALTWEALLPFMDSELLANEQEIRLLLQHNYFSLYTSEFNLVILQDIPLFTTGFNLPVKEKSYSYLWFRTALLQINALPLLDASAELICTLLKDSIFIEFINLYIFAAEISGSIHDFRLILDGASKNSKINWNILTSKWIWNKRTHESNLSRRDAEHMLDMLSALNYFLTKQFDEFNKAEFVGQQLPLFGQGKMEKVILATANVRESQAAIEVVREETLKLGKSITSKLDPILPYTKGFLPRKAGLFEVYVVRADDTGGPDAVNLLRRIFDNIDPDYIFYVGCAALLDEKYTPSENQVFVAARAIDSDKRQLSSGNVEYDLDLEKTDVTIIRNINVLNENEAFAPLKVTTNRYFISGSAFSNDRSSSYRLDLVKKFPKDAVVLEMEAFLVLKEMKKYMDEGKRFKYGVIKGISDFGDENAQGNKEESQRRATRNATAVITTLLKNI